jgi:hypothetical protein
MLIGSYCADIVAMHHVPVMVAEPWWQNWHALAEDRI